MQSNSIKDSCQKRNRSSKHASNNDVMQQVSFDLNRSLSQRASLLVKWIVRVG